MTRNFGSVNILFIEMRAISSSNQQFEQKSVRKIFVVIYPQNVYTQQQHRRQYTLA